MVRGLQHHPLGGADAEDVRAGVDKRKPLATQVTQWDGQVSGRELHLNVQDNRAAGELQVGVAVCQLKGAGGHPLSRTGFAVVQVDAGEHVGDFRTISADVLYRRGTGGARNAGQRFNTGQARFHRGSHNVVPHSASTGTNKAGHAIGVDLNTVIGGDHHNKIKVAVSHDEVGAAADDEEGVREASRSDTVRASSSDVRAR